MNVEELRQAVGYEFREELMKDKIHRFKTGSLFMETMQEKGGEPAFTLKGYDHKGLCSMRRLYVELADPTEYTQAMVLLGSWEHWERLSNVPWFKSEHLDAWRAELEVKLRSQAIMDMQESNSLKAKEFLANAKWKPDEKSPRRGRPTKEAISHQAKIEARILKSVDEHAAKLGIE